VQRFNLIMRFTFFPQVQRFIDSALEELEDSEGQGAWMDCLEFAYGRVHSLLLELSTSGTDLGDIPLSIASKNLTLVLTASGDEKVRHSPR